MWSWARRVFYKAWVLVVLCHLHVTFSMSPVPDLDNHLDIFPRRRGGQTDIHGTGWFEPWSAGRNPGYGPRGRTSSNVDAIDDFIENVMSCRHVPGLSVAVVSAGQLFMQKGFGQSNVEQGVDATEDTPFCIGSCTKAFVSSLIGVLLEENAERCVRVCVCVDQLSFRFVTQMCFWCTS